MFQDKGRSGGSPDLLAYKTADESVSSSADLQNDNHLSVTVTADRKYSFRLVLHVLLAAAGNGGIKFALNGSASYFRAKISSTQMASVDKDYMVTMGDEIAYTSASTVPQIIVLEGAFEASASGTFTLQWAQNSSDSDATTIKQGSYLAMWRMV